MKNKLMIIIVTIIMISSFLLGCGETSTSNNGEAIVNSEGNTEDNIEDSSVSYGEFTAVTMDGEEISNKIFEEYDLTMVNLWATWCKPCVSEMGELQQLYEGLSENINMITVCHDGEMQGELAKEILESNGATFTTIVANDEMKTTVLKDYMSFPTTVFVDKEGNIVGNTMHGAPSINVVEVYMDQINISLDRLGILE